MASPILSSIYLDRLDRFVETELIPQYTRGQRRADNPAYRKLASQVSKARRLGDRAQARALSRTLRTLPSQDPDDPGYRRLRYLRYAGDHLPGFTGPRAEAEEIKARLGQFLAGELRLDLSRDKTLITRGRTGAARFLGYEITIRDGSRVRNGRRTGTGTVSLRVPRTVIKDKCAPHLKRGEPACRSALLNADDYAIVAAFGAEYRGIVQYYLLAWDACRLARLRWVAETAMLKTLAGKHHSTAAKMARKHKTAIDTRTGGASASRPRSNAMAGNHWSHGSAESRCTARRTRSSTTASLTQAAPWHTAGNSSSASWPARASSAEARPTLRSTTSAGSPTSAGPDSPGGRRRCSGDAARRSSSADTAMPPPAT